MVSHLRMKKPPQVTDSYVRKPAQEKWQLIAQEQTTETFQAL